jgi:hypothetical protein
MVVIFQDKDKKIFGKYTIRNGFRENSTCGGLTERNLMTIYKKIGKILRIPDYKKEMQDEKNTMLASK